MRLSLTQRLVALLVVALLLTSAACSGPDRRDQPRSTPTATPGISLVQTVAASPTLALVSPSAALTTATATHAPSPTSASTATQPPPTSTATATATQPPTATVPATPTPDPRPADQTLGLPDVDAHYRLEISDLDVDSGLVVASETITIREFRSTPPERLFLQVVPAYDGFFTLERAVQQGVEVSPESLNGGFTLAFQLGAGVQAPYTIELAFHLNVGTEASGWGGTAKDGDALRLGYWFPIISTDHGYSATLDPSYSATASFEVGISLDPDIRFAHTGEITNEIQLDDGRKHYALTAENVRDFTLILSRSYLTDEAVSNSGVRIELFTLEASGVDQGTRDAILGWAIDAVDQLSDLIGPYPYPTFRIADAGPSMPGGVEFPNLIYINPHYDPLDRLIYHETAHQWLYGIIGNRTLQDGWIDEGGAEFFERGLPTGFTEVPEPPAGGYLYPLDAGYQELVPDASRSFYFSIYEQGARFYYAVLNQMGWDAFWAAMHELYDRFKFGIATAWDVLSIFQQHSPTDLRPLFDDTFRYEWIWE